MGVCRGPAQIAEGRDAVLTNDLLRIGVSM
jgi:hypothetical protein